MPPQRRRRMQFAPNRPGFFHPGPAMPRAGIQRNPLPALRAFQPQNTKNRGGFGFGKPNRSAPSQGFRFPATRKHAMSVHDRARLAETAARATSFAGRKLAEKFKRFAGPAGEGKHLPSANPLIGSELEEMLDDFYWTINQERLRNRFGRDKFEDQFKLSVVTAIAQGQIKSRKEMHEFIGEFGKEHGLILDPIEEEQKLFPKNEERKKLNGIFSSYKDLIRRGIIKVQRQQPSEEGGQVRRRAA